MGRKALAFITTHPIQYQAPLFRSLAAHPDLELEVFFCHQASAAEQADAGFGVKFDWDIPLLDGYSHRFLQNVARRPRIAGFGGLDTPEIKDIVARGRFAAVMINGWHYKSAWQTMRACWRTQTPVMVRSDSHLHNERSSVKRAGKWPVYNWFISRLDACVPVGSWSSDYFLHYGAAPERVFVVPHAIDTELFSSEARRLAPERNALRAQWGLDESAVVFLFAGKFTENKRPADFVDAVGHAARRGSRVAGLMVGDGPLRGACEELVNGENLPIAFAGFLNQSRISEAYAAADALVLPSTTETWGLVVNEAMACGLPCFVSDGVGCGPDMITTGETGAVFRLGDTQALGQLMSDFAANTEQITQMRERATEQAQKYTLRVAVDRMVAAVEAVSR